MDRLTTALAGRYRPELEIGAGGMATVYLAEDLKHKRKVALTAGATLVGVFKDSDLDRPRRCLTYRFEFR